MKLFSSDVPEEDLQAIKELISGYFLEKAKDEADQIWEERDLDSDELLKVHRRKPIAGGADFIVSDDNHFKVLKKIDFPKVKVLTANEFLIMLSEKDSVIS